MKKSIKAIFTGAGFLAGCSLVAKILGAFYRIPLTATLGAQGIGLYQTVFPVYTLMLTLCSGGVSVAVAKLTSTTSEAEGKKVLKSACLTFGLISVIAFVLLASLSLPISKAQGNEGAVFSYIAIAPSVVLVALASCYKGYHQGKQNMFPTAFSLLIEQIVKLSLGLLLARFFAPLGVQWAVFGALVGVTTSEVFSLLFLVLTTVYWNNISVKSKMKKQNGGVRTPSFETLPAEFSTDAVLVNPTAIGIRDSIKNERKPKNRDLPKTLIKTAMPVASGALVLPLTAVADSLLIINLLVSGGASTALSTALYGLYTGAVTTIVNLPAVIICSFSSALLPAVSSCGTRYDKARQKISFTLKISLLTATLCALALTVFSGEIISFLYGAGLDGEMERVGSILLSVVAVSVIFVSVVQVSTASMQGFGNSSRPALNLAIGGAIKIAVTAVGIIALGIYGAVLGTIACYLFTAVADFTSLNKTLIQGGEKRLNLPLKSLILPSVAFVIISIVMKILLLPTGLLLKILIGGGLGALGFATVLWTNRYFSADEKRRIKGFFRL
ncbi:MAG: polysaccharide biosynthesis protein [Clostridia bacterium]|nr:polysaccharide biosynthesis protein [Clostridia bacterium]